MLTQRDAAFKAIYIHIYCVYALYICKYCIYTYIVYTCMCIYVHILYVHIIYIWGHFIMLKSSIFQEDIAILNLCVFNNMLFRRDSQKRKAEWQRETDKPQSQEIATQCSSNCWDQQTKAVTEDARFPGLTQEAPTARTHTCRLHFSLPALTETQQPNVSWDLQSEQVSKH